MKLTSNSTDLIPKLPNEVAELILLRLPFTFLPLARSVSASWHRALTNSALLASKRSLSLSISLPYLFVFAFHPSTHQLQWLTFDLHSRQFLLLPPMPSDLLKIRAASSFAVAADRERGEIYVIGGMREEDGEEEGHVGVYCVGSNTWRVGNGRMRVGRAFFAAGVVGGKGVVVVGGGDGGVREVEMYHPTEDRWVDVAGMRSGMPRYDSAVVGRKMLVTEGWTWPFTFTPRGGIYDADRDVWEEMSLGMREGWTGISAVVGSTLFIITEYGEGRVKAYNPTTDKWTKVGGGGVPGELKKPYAVTGADEGKIYIVGKGMNVGVGSVVKDGKEWKIEWEVVKGPKAFQELSPCSSQVLYA